MMPQLTSLLLSGSLSFIAVLSTAIWPAAARAKARPMLSASALKVDLARLGTTARLLYVAAHPDDENTRLLTYFANHRHLDVAYLSLTRGGGGQNLVGPEQAELLAAIRTQELLAARQIDGARQFFTRARDFGYSKSPKETIAKWGRDAVLSDVVWTIRKFRPDVVVTRFNETGMTHGHHTASAQLARAAFEAAGDPARYPDQLERGVTAYRPHRLMVNVPMWRRSPETDVSGYLALDVGGYDPRLGASYGEIAARSRTMHKSQGFGATGRRGPIIEYFDTLAGPPPKEDLLEGVDLGWARLEDGQAVSDALAQAAAAFSVEAPERMVPALLSARRALKRVGNSHAVPRVTERIADCERLILSALGMHAEVRANHPEVAGGDTLDIELEIIVRRPANVRLTQVRWPGRADSVPATNLEAHDLFTVKRKLEISNRAPPSVAHWLNGPLTANAYPVSIPTQVAEPEDPPPLAVILTMNIAGDSFDVSVPIEHVWTDLVHGERRRPVIVVPPLMVSAANAISLFPGGQSREVVLVARAGTDGVEGSVSLEVPADWKSVPPTRDVTLAHAGDETTLRFIVTPPDALTDPVTVRPVARVGDRTDAFRYDVIDYPHLPVQGILRTPTIRLVPLDFVVPDARVAYVPGSGDTVDAYLRTAGLTVETIDAGTLRTAPLARYDTIIMGIRAYNTRSDELRAAYPVLMKWVENGGRLIVQYNTNNRWRTLTVPVGPYDFKIGLGRVTDETAKMKVLAPRHPIFRHPHVIHDSDFDGWVQERGLYFAESWNARYTPLLTAHDPGEQPRAGSLLVAEHGRGVFIYTGLSFFRQLPAGVPGAYRLLANLISKGP